MKELRKCAAKESKRARRVAGRNACQAVCATACLGGVAGGRKKNKLHAGASYGIGRACLGS